MHHLVDTFIQINSQCHDCLLFCFGHPGVGALPTELYMNTEFQLEN